MNNSLTKIVFFGTDDFSRITLQTLIDSGYNVVAVVTKPDSKSGRGQKLTVSSVKQLATEHGINVLQPAKVSEINDSIKAIKTKVMGVLASYGKIIPESTLNLFDPGIINIHPSLLPLYRGPSPIESAIKNGDSQTGVSIMKLSGGMDNGPIYGQMMHPLSGREVRPELYKTLANAGAVALTSLLPIIIDGSLQPIPQDESKAIYCKLLTKQDSYIEASSMKAADAERLVRAYLGFPKTKINILNHDIIITKSHVSNEYKTILDIKCQDYYLSIDELVAPSGRTMSARDFLNGYN